EIKVHFLRITREEVLAEHRSLILAVRALKIAELDNHHRRALGTETRGTLGFDLVEVGLEWILAYVVEGEVALDDLRAILRHQEREILMGLAGRGGNDYLLVARKLGGLRLTHLDGNLLVHHEHMADVGFQGGFVESRFL